MLAPEALGYPITAFVRLKYPLGNYKPLHDLLGTSCVMMRASRSLLGTLETTSGALAVYRAHILFQHKERYLHGTYGDDRALAMYSALEGEVVGVNEAVVWSAMPTSVELTYKQRLRWSKSWWCMIPFVLTNMTRSARCSFRCSG